MGLLGNKHNYRHGHGYGPNGKSTPTYTAWSAARGRCHNPNNKQYPRYGGRGIEMCQAWRDSFDSFLADMVGVPPALTLDRINNDQGYEAGNCRWATVKQQARNRRSSHLVTYDGITKPLIEWAEQYGLRHGTLHYRLTHGWSVHDALTGPKRKWPGPTNVRGQDRKAELGAA